jgi:RecA-family ATPase
MLTPELTLLADVQPEPVEWLWPGRIALGKLTMLAGDPGLGKSMTTLDMSARTSRGAPWPDTPQTPQPVGSVVLLSAEDDLGDTIRPRLDAHEADCGRIVALTSVKGSDGDGDYNRAVDLSRDVERVAAAIDSVGDCRLVVVDPISAFLGRTDSHKNAEVRAVLAPLAALAAQKRVAVLGVTHLTKGERAAIHRAMGSVAFVAAARAAWVVCPCKANPRRRLLLPLKNNLASDSAVGLAFTIEGYGPNGAPVVCWEAEPVTTTVDEALAVEPRKRGPSAGDREYAEAWLRSTLANGPRLVQDVTDEAVNAKGITKRTLERARQAIGVVAYRNENRGPWFLALPGTPPERQIDPRHKQLGDLGGVGQNPTFFDRLENQNATPPSFLSVGAEPSSNGHSTAETEWLP